MPAHKKTFKTFPPHAFFDRGAVRRLESARYESRLLDWEIAAAFFSSVMDVVDRGRVPLDCAQVALEMAQSEVEERRGGGSFRYKRIKTRLGAARQEDEESEAELRANAELRREIERLLDIF